MAKKGKGLKMVGFTFDRAFLCDQDICGQPLRPVIIEEGCLLGERLPDREKGSPTVLISGEGRRVLVSSDSSMGNCFVSILPRFSIPSPYSHLISFRLNYDPNGYTNCLAFATFPEGGGGEGEEKEGEGEGGEEAKIVLLKGGPNQSKAIPLKTLPFRITFDHSGVNHTYR